MKIEEALEKEITRGNCKTCPRNEDGVCDVVEEKIGSGEEYCELRPMTKGEIEIAKDLDVFMTTPAWIEKIFDYKPRLARSVLGELEVAQLYDDKRYILLYEEEFNELKNEIVKAVSSELQAVLGEEIIVSTEEDKEIKIFKNGWNAHREACLKRGRERGLKI